MDPRLEVLAAVYRNNRWINSFVAKGPIVIEWRTRPHWVVVDEKTEGYPFKKWVGMNILTGGNYRKFPDGTIPTSPTWLYKRQVKEELERNWPGRLMPVIKPFAHYIEINTLDDILPEDDVEGRKRHRETYSATNGTVCAVVSVIGSKIEGEELQEELKLPSAELSPSYLLGRIRSRDVGESKKPGLAVFTLDDLRGGAINNFAAGDGEKLRDYLAEEYEVSLFVAPTNGRSFPVTLPYSHSTPYKEWKELLPFLRVDPSREETSPLSPFR